MVSWEKKICVSLSTAVWVLWWRSSNFIHCSQIIIKIRKRKLIYTELMTRKYSFTAACLNKVLFSGHFALNETLRTNLIIEAENILFQLYGKTFKLIRPPSFRPHDQCPTSCLSSYIRWREMESCNFGSLGLIRLSKNEQRPW